MTSSGSTTRASSSGAFHLNGIPDHAAICLATLRRDGFVSLDGGEEGGSIVTEPFDWDGSRLFLNAVADEGVITVEVLEVDGRPLLGYGGQDATGVRVDSVRKPVVWRERSLMPNPAKGQIRLRFNITNAQLYSYWFE